MTVKSVCMANIKIDKCERSITMAMIYGTYREWIMPSGACLYLDCREGDTYQVSAYDKSGPEGVYLWESKHKNYAEAMKEVRKFVKNAKE